MSHSSNAAALWFEMTGHTPTEEERWAAWLIASLQGVNMFLTWEVIDGDGMPNVQRDVLALVHQAGGESRVELLALRQLRGGEV